MNDLQNVEAQWYETQKCGADDFVCIHNKTH